MTCKLFLDKKNVNGNNLFFVEQSIVIWQRSQENKSCVFDIGHSKQSICAFGNRYSIFLDLISFKLFPIQNFLFLELWWAFQFEIVAWGLILIQPKLLYSSPKILLPKQEVAGTPQGNFFVETVKAKYFFRGFLLVFL